MTLRRILMLGGIFAIFTGLFVDHGGHFGAEVTQTALFGLALGSVLALMRGTSPLARGIGFGSGFVIAWVAFALRAAVLPDIPIGHAVAAAMTVMVVTLVAAFSRGRIPLPSGLLGIATMTGAYESAFALNPTAFASESITAASTALFCAALGFFVIELMYDALPHRQAETEPDESATTRAVALPTQRDASHDEPAASAASADNAKGLRP